MTQGIQSTITGFQGVPTTLFSALDDNGVLTVAAIAALHKTRRDNCVIVSNAQGLECDLAFTDSMIRDSIDAWNVLRMDRLDDGSPRMVFTERARAADPSSMIESDGLNERGRQYRLAEHVGNVAVAVLATCFWAYRADSREQVLDTAASMVDTLLQGRAVTLSGIHPSELEPVYKHGFQVDQRYARAYWDRRDRRPPSS